MLNNRPRDGARGPAHSGENRPALVEEGILITSLALEPIAVDPGALSILSGRDAASPGSSSRVRIPKEFVSFVRGSASGGAAQKSIHVRIGGCDYNCRAYMMKRPENGIIAEPVMVVHLQRASYPHNAIRRVASEYHLTDREQEALLGISMGLTSKELAKRMSISPNTVKTFLRTIMIKMGVTTRTGILSKLLESNGPSQAEKPEGQTAG
jgi:DNA-binding CsgD family transcriptional regulator